MSKYPYLIHDEDEHIIASGVVYDTACAYRMLREGERARITPEKADPLTQYWDTELGAVANKSPLPKLVTSGSAPFTLDVSALPEGTRATIGNAAGEQTQIEDVRADPPRFVEPGTYTVILRPPARFLRTEFDVDVTDA